MPATRHARSRTDKIDEIVAAACRLFAERGYEATTVGAIASEVGIASNVVFWYFETKDHLFVAALEAMLLGEMAAATRRAERGDSLEVLLPWVVGQLVDTRRLIAAVHQRAPISPVVGEFHDRTHQLYENLLAGALAERCPDPTERQLATEALITAMEGLVLHGASPAKTRRTIHFLLDRLTCCRRRR
jgi:AcrR family transcriptional regulator